MDYMNLAKELLDVRLELVRTPAAQMISKMERGEYFILSYLLTHKETVHPKELSTAMAVSTARIAMILKTLENKKQIQRRMDDTDMRQVVVLLTDAGRKRIQTKREETLLHIHGLLQALGPEDAQAYIRIQRKIWKRYYAQS